MSIQRNGFRVWRACSPGVHTRWSPAIQAQRTWMPYGAATHASETTGGLQRVAEGVFGLLLVRVVHQEYGVHQEGTDMETNPVQVGYIR